MKLFVRDILWLTVVCAVFVAWMRDRGMTARAHDKEIIALQIELEEANGSAMDWESQADSMATFLRWEGYKVRASKEGVRIDSPSLLDTIIRRLLSHEWPSGSPLNAFQQQRPAKPNECPTTTVQQPH